MNITHHHINGLPLQIIRRDWTNSKWAEYVDADGTNHYIRNDYVTEA